MQRLNGKAALVTGGSRGIGRGIAERLAEEGAAVVINYVEHGDAANEAAAAIRSKGGRAIAAQADVSDESAAARLVATAVDAFGGIHILVNNAGIMQGGFLEQASTKSLFDNLRVNYLGTLCCCKAVIPHFKKQCGGRIINCSSISGTLPDVEQAGYGASKAAIENLTRVLAGELGKYNVTVNAYAPGLIHSDMTAPILGTPPIADLLLDRMCLRRFGDPRDVGNLCVFLASDEASYITGATIPIDGGMLCVQAPWRAVEDSTGSRELAAKLAGA